MTAIEESTTGAVPVAVGSVRTPLGARVAAEFVGTAALVTVVVGSGIQATGLTRDVGVQLLANSLATVFGLGVLIVLLGPVSGAHFNPVVTLAEWWTERRSGGVGDPEAAGRPESRVPRVSWAARWPRTSPLRLSGRSPGPCWRTRCSRSPW